MKQITKMSRLTGQMEKMFHALNEYFFQSQLPAPIITVVPSSRSYAHYTPFNAWDTKDGGRREINIASGTLDRPLEEIAGSLLHEMVHMYNDVILNVQDTSRRGTYHNGVFRREAEAHGLWCHKTEKYGWAFTEPGDALLDWVIDHDEFREIEMCRTAPDLTASGIGAHAASAAGFTATSTNPNSHSRRYSCPCCGAIVRATKIVHIVCGDCGVPFLEG